MFATFLVAAALFGFALVSERVERSPVTAPMVFTAVGLLGGADVLGVFDFDVGTDIVRILVEATLAMALFSGAVAIDLPSLRRHAWLPARLLGIGLPLTIGLGTVVATVVFPGLSLLEAGLLAAILTPTDAALGRVVVTDERVPVPVREGLTIESGLNDGIMVPVVTVLATALAREQGRTAVSSLRFAAEQIGFGALCGILVGIVGGRLLHRAFEAGRISGSYQQLGTLAVPVAAYASATALGGNGFIAAFVAGMGFASQTAGESRDVAMFTDDEGALFTNITFVIFGALFVGPAVAALGWQIAVYAVASLTIVRGVAVLVAQAQTGNDTETRLFIAWFGPRGLASVLFTILVAEQVAGPTIDAIVATATCTVLGSIVLHGLTAAPWTARLGRRHRPDAGSSAAGGSQLRT